MTGGYFLQKNAHGDVTAAISGTERVATYDYDAFGNAIVEEGEINNPIRYSGEYLDEETGLIYLRARYYDPSVGRFISEDTHWTPKNMIYGDNPDKDNSVPNISAIMQSSNLYVYCTNNPVMLVDPTGEYNRQAAVAYAKLHSIHPDEGELRFNQDCTNFVSWCLLEGDLQESDDWYFNYAIAGWIPGKGRVVYGSYSATWVQANELFQCFINYCNEFPNSPYVAGPPLEIFGKETLQRRILEGGFQVGDLLFWDYGNTGTMDHAAIIVEITDRDIIYAAHDSDKNNGSVRDFYNGNDYAVIYIVRVPDNA